MSNNSEVLQPWAGINSQPEDVRDLPDSRCDSLIVSETLVEGHWVSVSRYGDDCWQLVGMPSNIPDNKRFLNFQRVPVEFRAVMKAVMYRYLRRGRKGQQRPKGMTLRSFFIEIVSFLSYLDKLSITRLTLITPIICKNFANESLEHIQSRQSKGKLLSQTYPLKRVKAVETLYELSQYTHDPIPQHPWPETSAYAMAGLVGRYAPKKQGFKTPLMPDEVFCTLFKKAYEQVQGGQRLLNLRDEVASVAAERRAQSRQSVLHAKNKTLAALGWKGSFTEFNKAILDLRTACYIVLASTSGCRNHELANVQTGAHHRVMVICGVREGKRDGVSC